MLLVFSLLVMFVAFYLLYSTSQRAVFKRRAFNHWLLRRAPLAKAGGLGLVLLSFALFSLELGVAGGIFFALTTLMTFSSLVILFHPLEP